VSKLIKHSGVISQIIGNNIVVDIQRSSACANCESKAACATLNAQTQQINCSNDDYELKIGDCVNVVSERRQSMYAIMAVFAIPLLLFILAIIVCSEIFNLNEGLSAIAAFSVIALYYVILHFFDYKIKNKINFRIEKQNN
jgi:positive regulator of sigma E activity